MEAASCRSCGSPLNNVFCDLGLSPIANSYVAPDKFDEMEPFYPLRAMVCSECMLVQVGEFERREQIFSDDYAYFSSFSTSWLEHCRRFADASIDRFDLGPQSRVVEIASNDGYLLRYFKDSGIPVFGIEPSASVAGAALQLGVPTLVEFFGEECADKINGEWKADLLVANNVLPHVPDLHDFVGGLKRLLKSDGTVTIEFQHLLRLIETVAFDTIYHEHFSYFSYLTVRKVLADHGLAVYDVEELSTHGGSLRVYAAHVEAEFAETERSRALIEVELSAGLDKLDTHLNFTATVEAAKRQILSFFIEQRELGNTLVGYGAPAKGNTLLNYCGVRSDMFSFVVDLNPAKQGSFLPGSRLEIKHPDAIAQVKPDVIVIAPWNLRDEIAAQLEYTRDWGARLATRTPELAFIN